MTHTLIKNLEDQRLVEAFAKKTYRFRIGKEVHIAVLAFGRHGDDTESHFVVPGAEIRQLAQLMQNNDEEKVEEILEKNYAANWDLGNAISMTAAAMSGGDAAKELVDRAGFDHLGLVAEEVLMSVAATAEKAKSTLRAMKKDYEIEGDDDEEWGD